MLKLFSLGLAAQVSAITLNKNLGSYSIGLKTLVLYSFPADQTIARVMLEGYGTNYDIMNSIPELNTPKYNVIVVCDQYFNEGRFETIRDYCDRYNVRLVFLSSPMDAELGVKPIKAGVKPTPTLVFDESKYATMMSDVMNVTGNWDATNANLYSTPVTITNTTRTAPFMRYTSGTARTGKGPVAAFVTTFPSGREEMHFTFRAWENELCATCPMPMKDQPNYTLNAHYTKLNLALANVWFQWATKGIYLGQRRIFFQPEVDDWFIRSEIFGNNYMFRLNGTDVENAAMFLRGVPKKVGLAPGSFIKFEPGFNGAGHTNWGLQQNLHEGKDLNSYTKKYLGDFHWISHTWSHQNLDWLNADQCPSGKPSSCRVSKERIQAEIRTNKLFATGHAIDPKDLVEGLKVGLKTPAGSMFGNNTELYNLVFSEDAMVTPDISGLYPRNYNMSWWNHFGEYPVRGDFDAIQGIYKEGIRAVVGDDSRRELMNPTSFHHGVMTTMAEYGQDGLLIVPRQDINIAYNSNNETTFLFWYNNQRACQWSVGLKCEDRDYTFEEAMERQTNLPAYTRLAFRADPFMFHQANVGSFVRPDGSVHSLISYWTEHSLRDILLYVTGMPITSPKLSQTAQFFRNRMSRDACNITATMVYEDGVPQSVFVDSLANCTALISVQNNEFTNTNPQNYDGKEAYGNDNTYQINLAPGKSKVVFLG